jgi:archaetidylinositol phosphate synthase
LTDPYAAVWLRLHGGLQPSPLVRRWLRLMWTLARPIARVPPTAITLAGVVLAVDAALLAGDVPLASLGFVLASALCDGLDGAVAVVGRSATRFGALADAVADRIADCAFAVAVWRCGAPWWLAGAAGALSLVHELSRAWPGGRRRTTITVAERPTRVVCAALAASSAAASDASWPPTVCAAAWTGAALIGLGQLARTGLP